MCRALPERLDVDLGAEYDPDRQIEDAIAVEITDRHEPAVPVHARRRAVGAPEPGRLRDHLLEEARRTRHALR